MLDIYPWQYEQMQRLSSMCQQKRLPHALLFSGLEGIGLKQFTLSFAMKILCISKDNQSKVACGKCKSCELFKAKSNPDLKLILPEEKGKLIKVDQVRELIDYVSFKSFLGGIKIVIINPADAMNRSTANALLKTLEEPPTQSMLILLTHRPSILPVTIRSRCQKINFKPTYDKAANDWLDINLKNPQLSSDLLLRLARGGPLKVIELMNEDYLSSRHGLLEDLDILDKQNIDPLKIVARWQNLGAENTVSWLIQIINDLVRLKLCPDKATIMNLDLREDLQGLTNTLDLLKLMRGYDFILLKYKELKGPMNYNSSSILEEIALFWKNYDNSTT